jgi:hypothetical protein
MLVPRNIQQKPAVVDPQYVFRYVPSKISSDFVLSVKYVFGADVDSLGYPRKNMPCFVVASCRVLVMGFLAKEPKVTARNSLKKSYCNVRTMT